MDVFDLVAKIRLDSSEYEQGVGKAKGTFSSLASGVGKGLATVAKVGAAAVTAGAAGITALTNAAVQGYGQYEQLAGGVQKIFDQMDNSKVFDDAAKAWQDLNMSANEYLEKIVDVGANFASTMGDQKGYEAARRGMLAISDYASGTGRNINELSQKFTLITRSAASYQSIADQFSGVLPATSKDFLAQAQAAGLLSDSYTELTQVPIAEYQDAVSQMLEKGVADLGLTSNTANETASTITGSFAAIKATWSNLVAGMADENANMEVLIGNFVNSVGMSAQNLLPTIKQALSGIGTLITELSPVIAEALPTLVESVLPTIITSGASLIAALGKALVTALPAVGKALLDALKILLTDVFGVSEKKAGEFATGIMAAFTTIKDGFFSLVEQAQTDGTWLNEIWTGLMNAGQLFKDFLVALWDALSLAFHWCVEKFNTEGTLLNTIWENIKTFIAAAISVIQDVIGLFTAVLKGDWSAAWEYCKNIASTVWDAITGIISSLVGWITGFLGTMVDKGFELIASLAQGIQNKFAELFTLVGGWVTDNIITPIANMGTDLYNAGVNLLNQFWDGLKSVWNSIVSWWEGLKLKNKKAPKVSGGDYDDDDDADGYATGLNYVPYDGFPAILHRGEAVLTSAEARLWRKGGMTPAVAGAGITINQYIQSVPQTPVDLANTTEAYFEQARWML